MQFERNTHLWSIDDSIQLFSIFLFYIIILCALGPWFISRSIPDMDVFNLEMSEYWDCFEEDHGFCYVGLCF